MGPPVHQGQRHLRRPAPAHAPRPPRLHGSRAAHLTEGSTLYSIYAGFVFGWLPPRKPPNRWLHLRHPNGFSDPQFRLFAAQCRISRAYTEAVLAEWLVVEPGATTVPRYRFFPPTREGHTVSLPIGGDRTLATRAALEDAASHLLSDRFPLEVRLGLDEGLTETLDPARGPQTSWRRVLRPR